LLLSIPNLLQTCDGEGLHTIGFRRTEEIKSEEVIKMAGFAVGDTVENKDGVLYEVLYLKPEAASAMVKPVKGGEAVELPAATLSQYQPFENIEKMTDDILKSRLAELRQTRKVSPKKKSARKKSTKPKKERVSNIPVDFE
jgi:hypothetical protein